MANASHDIALADTLVADLTEAFPGQFTAERTWCPDWGTRSELNTLQVAVQPSYQPAGELFERETGLELLETWPIDLAFAQRLTQKTRTEIDALVNLVDQVRELLQTATVDIDDGRQFVGLGFEFLARFDPGSLQCQALAGSRVYTGSFLSIVRFNFQRLA